MTFREWVIGLEARAASLVQFQPGDGPVEARYALGYDDIKLLRDIDAAFRPERAA